MNMEQYLPVEESIAIMQDELERTDAIEFINNGDVDDNIYNLNKLLISIQNLLDRCLAEVTAT